MTWIAVAVGVVGSVAGGVISGNAAKSAANTQAEAALEAARIAAEQRQPWVDAGKIGLDAMAEGIKPGGQFTQKFTMEDATNMPAMQFALQQGTQAVENSAAAKSGLLNSNAMQDTVKFAEANASQFQTQAFNQWLAQQQLLMKPLETMAGMGSNMINSVADTNANAILAAGGARAAGQVGAANSMASGISGAANQWQQMNMLKDLLAPTGRMGGMDSLGPAPSRVDVPNFSAIPEIGEG